MNKVILIPAVFLLFIFSVRAQVTYPVNGVQDKNQVWYAFKNATLHTDYKTTLDKATLLIRKGKIIEVGNKVDIPKGAVVYDLQGKHIYPSLIDIYSDYGMPEQDKKKDKKQKPQFISEKNGSFSWNEAIHPESNASDQLTINKTQGKNLRNLGFGAVLTHQQDGIARGTSAFVTLGESRENEVAIKGKAAAHYSFSKGTSTQDNPSSLMGAIALLRQTFYDAEWYRQTNGKEEYNISLEAFNRQQRFPQIFEVPDYLTALRASKIGEEFDVQYIIKGAGDEYKRLDDMKNAASAFIIPLGFPKPYDVEDPYDAMLVSTEDMKHWELAPANAAYLDSAGIPFALTITGLEDKKDFNKNIRKMISYGLADSLVLKAFTYTPARLLGMQDTIGSLKPGMVANFIITSEDLFDENTIIYENWVQGKPFVLEDKNLLDIRGEYSLNVNTVVYDLKVSGKPDKLKGEIVTEKKEEKIKVKINQDKKLINLYFGLKDDDKSYVRLSGKINYQSGSWDGQAQLPDGKWVSWSAIRKKKTEEEAAKDTAKADSAILGRIFYPNMAYGYEKKPVQEDLLIKNVTVWTNEEQGIMKNTDVLIRGGKIDRVEKEMDPPLDKEGNLMVKVINGTGKHLTPGIIDEHSHIAISRGVNEGTQSVSAEVSIAHVVNSDDVNIYRQLAGGVTAAQLLHGSANAIGGQSALVKLRWGQNADSMNINNSDGFIKFALGENVKQSNWGDNQTERYPQTRMGVEQVFYDAFIRAEEYKKRWEEYNNLKKKEKEKTHPPRKDLELEALVEILDKKRFITCHSYVQSEINMLMHVADSMGFKINTFTHILEGYKVADKMKLHGAGGSTFSDWWAYKFEVNDAIPYNGALMHEQGIITAFNSDDAEMGRRLNQEAAKAVKYGGVSEEDALKFVTLNPAKLLHLDHRMGSIKAGKDADLVIWSDNPLSIYSRVEKTFIDGTCYYDAETDAQLREAMAAERVRIMAKMIKAKEQGEKTKKPEKKEEKHYHCDSMEDEGR